MQRGDLDEAIRHLKRAYEKLEKFKNRGLHERILDALTDAYLRLGRQATARDDSEEARHLFGEAWKWGWLLKANFHKPGPFREAERLWHFHDNAIKGRREQADYERKLREANARIGATLLLISNADRLIERAANRSEGTAQERLRWLREAQQMLGRVDTGPYAAEVMSVNGIVRSLPICDCDGYFRGQIRSLIRALFALDHDEGLEIARSEARKFVTYWSRRLSNAAGLREWHRQQERHWGRLRYEKAAKGGRLGEAERIVREMIERDPQDPGALRSLAEIQEKRGDIEAEIETHWRIVDLQGTSGAYNNLGVAMHRAGKTAQAEKAYRKATEINPDNFWAHHNLGHRLWNKGPEYTIEAEQMLRRALAIPPRTPKQRKAQEQLRQEIEELAAYNQGFKRTIERWVGGAVDTVGEQGGSLIGAAGGAVSALSDRAQDLADRVEKSNTVRGAGAVLSAAADAARRYYARMTGGPLPEGRAAENAADQLRQAATHASLAVEAASHVTPFVENPDPNTPMERAKFELGMVFDNRSALSPGDEPAVDPVSGGPVAAAGAPPLDVPPALAQSPRWRSLVRQRAALESDRARHGRRIAELKRQYESAGSQADKEKIALERVEAIQDEKNATDEIAFVRLQQIDMVRFHVNATETGRPVSSEGGRAPKSGTPPDAGGAEPSAAAK